MQPEILRTLEEVADPKHSALIIIDPQCDFCSRTGAMAQRFGLDMKEINEAVPHLNAFIQRCREAGVFVVWVKEIFSDRKMLPNQKALWGAGEDIWLIKEGCEGVDWYGDMIPPLVDEPLITKWQYDAFEDTELHLLLQSQGIKTLLMTGFTSNVCVETTARHGYIKGYYIVMVADCTAAPTVPENEAALFNIRTYFGHVATSRQIGEMWKGA